jgi:5-methylcytosine-specific restriction endonuclease McrA
MTFTAQYTKYLESLQWKVQREKALRRAGFKCERCGMEFKHMMLHVHHKNYERLGKELPEDLEVLCLECHPKADEERKTKARRKHENARLDGWASKKYGENWAEYMDEDAVAEEFEDWLERNEE